MQHVSTSLNKSWLSQFWQLAWPVSLQAVLMSLLGLVDVLMVAKLGETEVAAVGYASRAFFVALVIMHGFATVCTTLCSQHWAKRDWNAIGNTTVISGYLGMAFAGLTALLFMWQPQWIMQLASSDPQLISAGSTYMLAAALMLVFTLPISVVEAALRSTGETKLPLYISVLAVGLNIALNQVLIFGFAGIPAMGVAGAGIASVLARIIQLAVLWLCLQAKQHPLLPAIRSNLGRFEKAEYAALLKLAIPLLVNFTIWPTGVFAYATIYGRLGTEALAAMSMISPIESIAISCFMGFSAACSILIGNKLGANEFRLALSDAKTAMLISPIAAAALGICLWFISAPLLSLFGELSAETMDMTQQLVVVLAASVWLRTFNMVMINGVLRSGGDNSFCLLSDTFCQWGIGIMLTAIAVFVFEVSLVVAFCVALSEEVVKALICLWRVQQKVWVRNLTELGVAAS